jgi:hypothetical protein
MAQKGLFLPMMMISSGLQKIFILIYETVCFQLLSGDWSPYKLKLLNKYLLNID